MSLASKLPWTHRFAGGFPGLSSQPLPTDADAIDYLSRMATADGAGVEVGVATAVDAFFRDTKAAGVFDALKACCILAGARTLTGALVPVVGDAVSPNGFVSGDFSRTSGLGDSGGTSYLITGLAYNAVDTDDEHLAVYGTSIPPTGPNNLAGGGTYPSPSFSAMRKSSTLRYYECQVSSITSVAGAFAAGFVGMSRGNASSYEYLDASSSGTINKASSTRSNVSTPYGVFCSNYSNLGTLGATDATLSFFSIGSDIGSAGLAALETAVDNLITAIGEAI